MAEDLQQWIHFIHPHRENLVDVGPAFSPGLIDGIAVIEAPDAAAAQVPMNADPAITSGGFTGELRPMHVASLSG